MRFLFNLVFILFLISLESFGQSFEITDGQSMCIIGKGPGQDATINPYAKEDFSYALVENIGTVEFQIRITSNVKDIKQFPIQPNGVVVIKLFKDEILYFDAITTQKAKATIRYTLDERELPPPPPPVN